MDINIIRSLCNERKIRWTVHVSEMLHSRGITRQDIIACIQNGEIIEDYPDDYPFPSCLIYGLNAKNKVIHVVVGCDNEELFIVTAYYPNKEKQVFEDDLKTRKEK